MMNLHDDLRTLPEPVSRYFELALAAERRAIRAVRMTQSGVLRTDPRRLRWMKFRAEQVVAPQSRSFSWEARVRVGPLLHVQVRDSYASGVGSGQVRLFSAFTVASDANRPELNAASLHRYLAEAVWYPTALLPSAGVQWSATDDLRGLAMLRDRGNEVSLEFRFNDLAEVVGIYTEARWSKTANGFERMAWEGHFSGHRRHAGLLVPATGEVGWYVDGRLELVWKGEIISLEYEFEPAA